MKNFLYTSLIAIIIATTLFSCKKDKAAEVAGKDYSVSIKDKTWWGEFTNEGETVQYYSVHFNADNSLLWSQFSGDYTGTWSLVKNKLMLNFTNPAFIVTAEITEDNKLLNITTNTVKKVNSGEMVANPNIILENTVWSGSFSVPDVTIFQLSFLPGLTVKMKIGSITYELLTYNRVLSGGCIRIKNPFPDNDIFGVITPSGVMKGCVHSIYKCWNIIKQ